MVRAIVGLSLVLVVAAIYVLVNAPLGGGVSDERKSGHKRILPPVAPQVSEASVSVAPISVRGFAAEDVLVRVESADGEPLAGAKVSLRSVLRDEVAFFGVSDTEGATILSEVADGRYSVACSHSLERFIDATVELDANNRRVTIQAKSWGEIEGIALGIDKKPVPGTEATLRGPQRFDGEFFSLRTVGVGPDGSFEFSGLYPEASYELRVLSKSCIVFPPRDKRVYPDTGTVEITLLPVVGARLRFSDRSTGFPVIPPKDYPSPLRLEFPAGFPAAKPLMAWRHLLPEMGKLKSCGDKECLVLFVVRGYGSQPSVLARLTGAVRCFSSVSEDVEVKKYSELSSSEPQEIFLDRPPGNRLVRFRVIDRETRVPMANQNIALFFTNTDSVERLSRRETVALDKVPLSRNVLLDEEGFAPLCSVPAGEYVPGGGALRLKGNDPFVVSTPSSVDDEIQEVTLTARRLGTLSVGAVDSRGCQLLDCVVDQIRKQSQGEGFYMRGSMRPKDDGRVVLRNLPLGVYRISVRVQGRTFERGGIRVLGEEPTTLTLSVPW